MISKRLCSKVNCSLSAEYLSAMERYYRQPGRELSSDVLNVLCLSTCLSRLQADYIMKRLTFGMASELLQCVDGETTYFSMWGSWLFMYIMHAGAIYAEADITDFDVFAGSAVKFTIYTWKVLQGRVSITPCMEFGHRASKILRQFSVVMRPVLWKEPILQIYYLPVL